MSLIASEFILQKVYALPTFEALEGKTFNEIVDSQIASELRHLTENLTDDQKSILRLILGI
jgi:hypothetical protein